jgi:hypothetical protein
MGSHPTLVHPNPARDSEGVSTHLAPQQRTAEVQPIICDLEQAFDRLNPDYGVPADTATPTATKPSATAKPPSRSALALRSPAAARTTPARSCGWPARTTGPPTLPALPATR